MPRIRRRPNTVASQATAGAMKICEPIAAVESQAPSSKPSEKAPRRSGNPTEVRRLSKLARKDPSSTAPTANNGWGAMPPRDSGPWPVSLFSAIGRRFVGANSCDHRHPRQQALQQWLALVERDPDRDALHHLGEIAGGVVGREQCELRSAGGRNSLDAARQFLAWETVDGHLDRLPRLRSGSVTVAAPAPDGLRPPGRAQTPAAPRLAQSWRIAARPGWRDCLARPARRSRRPPPARPGLGSRRDRSEPGDRRP